MKILKKFISFLLAISTLFLVACVKDNNNNGGVTSRAESDDVEYIHIADGELSDYVIVTPKGKTDIFSEAYALSQSIKAVSGANIKVCQDTYGEQEREILVGITSREVEGAYKTSVETPDDYTITVVGKKILIYGFSINAVSDAVKYFTETYINGASNKTVKIPIDTLYTHKSSTEFLTVTGDYVISAEPSNGEGAIAVQEAIKNATGLTLDISTVIGKQDKEIIICGIDSVTEKLSTATAFEGKVGVLGNKLIIYGGSKESAVCMAKEFSKNIKNYMFGDKIMISKNNKESKSFAEVAESVLKSINFDLTGAQQLTSKVEEVEVYTPDGSESAWYYSHHPFMTFFKGKYYIIYSSGRRNEDDFGQRVMLATSTDFKNWIINPLMDSLQGHHSEEVLTAFGFYEYEGKLTAYVYAYEYIEGRPSDENYIFAARENQRVFALQTEDGTTWSTPKEICKWKGGGGNQSPERFGDLLIWAGFGSISYTTDLTGMSGWKDVKLSLAPNTEKPEIITESGIYQTSDGTLVLMSRTNGGTSLAAASFDGGYTWTNMYRSSFKDYGAKFQFGTLPDGRHYYIGNLSSGRKEAVLMVSDDGVNFDKVYYLGVTSYTQQQNGLYKGGNYGYPTTYIDDEYLHVVYSRGKEAVGALRIRLSEIK